MPRQYCRWLPCRLQYAAVMDSCQGTSVLLALPTVFLQYADARVPSPALGNDGFVVCYAIIDLF